MATEAAQSGTSQEVPPDVSEHLTTEDRVGLLRAMLMMRGIEERAMTLYRQGKVPGSFYDGFGQEAVSAGPAWAMAAAGPPLHPAPRPRGARHPRRRAAPASSPSTWAARAASPAAATATCTSATARKGCVGMVSMLPDMMLIATGLAMAFKLRGEQRVAMTWFGDGSTSRGDFHEAMNWAGVQRLPVIFILENNQYAYSTPVDQQFAVDPVERAAAYGFPGVKVDGNDCEAMFEAVRVARERALADEGPTLIEAVTMRMHGHAAHDDMKYVPQARRSRSGRRRTRSTARRAASRRSGSTSPPCARRSRRRSTPRSRPRSRAPMPDGMTATDRLFADEPALLEDGNAPWSGFAKKAAPDADDDLPAGDLRRHARGDALRRARLRDGRGHRRRSAAPSR